MNAFRHLQTAVRNVKSSSSSRTLASRVFIAVAMVGSHAPIATLCEKKKGDFLAKDVEGNVDWMATLSRVPNPDFWDDVATATGSQV